MNFIQKRIQIIKSMLCAFTVPFTISSLAFLYGCGGQSHDHGDHGHDHGDHGQAGHDSSGGHDDHDDHGHGGAIAVTQYTDKSELFMEYEPLLKDLPTELIIHLTRTSDFTPITSGTLEVRLVSATGQTYSDISDAPARDGIFLPIVVPPFSGTARMELHLRSAQLDDVQIIEDVEIHEPGFHPPHEEEETDDPNAISFLKEQQWKINYAIEPVRERPIRQATPAVATFQLPAAGQALLPAPTSGIVRFAENETSIEIGAETNQGQTLFFIEPDASWQAGLAKLSEEYQLAQAEQSRVSALQKQNAVSEKRVIEAQIRLQTLRNALEQLGGEAALDNPSQLRAIAKSPLDGIASAIYVKPGQRVEAGEALALIVNPSRLVLEAQVVPARLDLENRIVDASFRPAGSQRLHFVSELNGRLLTQTPLADRHSGIAVLRFLIDNPEGKLIAGSRTTAHLLSGEATTTGVAVPNSAIHEEEGIPIIYVQTEGETIEKRYPKLGLNDGAYTHAKTGLRAGERVVTKGATFIRLATLSTSEMGHGHAH